METTAIIKACLNKNRKAEKVLFDTFSHSVYKKCQRYSIHDAEAKDFLQECFIHLFQKLSKYDPSKGPFKPWLSKLCTNKILELKRKDKKRKIELSSNHFPDIEIEENDFEYITQEELLTAIRKLPDGYRSVLNLYVFDNWSHKDIGTILGITEGASRSQLSRAKSLLKKILIQSIPNIYEKRLA